MAEIDMDYVENNGFIQSIRPIEFGSVAMQYALHLHTLYRGFRL